jgi:pimeloyl-ACP methyl ester carboxylesterase
MRLDRSWIGFLSLISISGAFAHDANAGWKPAAVRQFRKLDEKVRKSENDELQAIRSSAKVDLSAPLRSLRFRKEEYRDAETFGPGGEEAYYLYSRTGRKVSPLVIFFPGVFGNPMSGGSLMVGRQLRRARNHVVILPNPWGSVFQKARPNFMPGDFEAEARAMVRMAKHAIDRIGRDRISRVEFFGESYGGFLAPVTAAILSKSGDFDVRSVTSVSVPYHVGNAIRAIDTMADESEDEFFEGGCRWKVQGIFRLVGFVYELLLNRKDSETYARKTVGCSRAIFAYVGFQQPLYALAEDLSRRTRNEKWPEDPGDEWRRKLRFRDFGNLFFGKNTIQMISRDSANLGYWTDLLNRRGIATRALVAKNDPLNPPPGVGVQRVVLSYKKDDLLVLSSGGHLGFRGEGHYRRLIRAQYNARNEGQNHDETEGPDEDFDNSPAAGTGEDLDGDAEETT